MSAAAAAALLGILAAGPSGLQIAGDATCPSPADVARRLDDLLPKTGDAPAREATAARVVVTRGAPASTLRLALLGPIANELATRELPAEGTCEELASAAAVVVAAWRADLDPDLTPSVALPARTPPPTPASSPALAIRAAPLEPARPARLELGLGLIVSDVGGAVAPGAILTAGLGHGELGLVASLMATTSRDAPVGALANAASWTRVTLALGPAWQPRRGNLRADLHVQGLLGVLHVRGVGLMDAASDTTPELGGGAGAKLGLVTGTSAMWLGLDVLGWPGAQRLIITGNPDQGRLGRLELVASVGLSLGRFP